VARPQLGTKRDCPDCGAKFYDLNREPLVCPKCGYTFTAEMASPPARGARAAAAVSTAPAAGQDAEEDVVGVESPILPLDSDAAASDVDDDDDETAVVGDSDLPEIEDEEEIEDDSPEDVFLEEEEDDGDPVTDIIGGASADDERDG